MTDKTNKLDLTESEKGTIKKTIVEYFQKKGLNVFIDENITPIRKNGEWLITLEKVQNGLKYTKEYLLKDMVTFDYGNKKYVRAYFYLNFEKEYKSIFNCSNWIFFDFWFGFKDDADDVVQITTKEDLINFKL